MVYDEKYTLVNLPADLLSAISAVEGGRVVVVTGAGCSFEAPTGLPLARQCAIDVHRLLVDDTILDPWDCSDPEDLSCIADAVFLKRNSQSDLVSRLPIDRFRHAEPNEGHLLAAAMLREKAIRCLVTLNFDLAMTSALTDVGGQRTPGYLKMILASSRWLCMKLGRTCYAVGWTLKRHW